MNNNNGTGNKDQTLDCEGFLNDTEFWSIDLAEKLAKKNDVTGYGLTDIHWEIINYIREFYKQYERGPEAVKVAKNSGISMDALCALFPCGLVKGAYKVAGLPRPPGCL